MVDTTRPDPEPQPTVREGETKTTIKVWGWASRGRLAGRVRLGWVTGTCVDLVGVGNLRRGVVIRTTIGELGTGHPRGSGSKLSRQRRFKTGNVLEDLRFDLHWGSNW